MIDFAQSTGPGMRGDAPFSGPDRGYLLGLANLIRFLRCPLLFPKDWRSGG